MISDVNQKFSSTFIIQSMYSDIGMNTGQQIHPGFVVFTGLLRIMENFDSQGNRFADF